MQSGTLSSTLTKSGSFRRKSLPRPLHENVRSLKSPHSCQEVPCQKIYIPVLATYFYCLLVFSLEILAKPHTFVFSSRNTSGMTSTGCPCFPTHPFLLALFWFQRFASCFCTVEDGKQNSIKNVNESCCVLS